MLDKYKINLNEEEIKTFKEIIHNSDSNPARKVMHANILLKTNDLNLRNKTNEEISQIFGVTKKTINQIRKTYINEGLEGILKRRGKVTAPILSKITGDFESHIIATAQNSAKNERAQWTLKLLEENCIGNRYIVTFEVSSQIIQYWSIKKESDANFVASMEDILSIYQNPYDPMIPILCIYERQIDTNNRSIFIFTEPLTNWRYIAIKEPKTKYDFALMLSKLYKERYSNAEKVILICDSLNAHSRSSFYEAFPSKTAYELSKKYEFHYTPAQGNWLNIAKCELSSLSKERINSIEPLNEEKDISWQFTIEDARTKLKHLYPTPSTAFFVL